MAKVGTFDSIEICGEWIAVSFYYTSKSLFHLKLEKEDRIPDNFRSLSGIKNTSGYETESDLRHSFSEAAREYNKNVSVERKVIAVRVVIDILHISDNDSYAHINGVDISDTAKKIKPGFGDSFEGSGVSFQYGVFVEVGMNDKKKYYREVETPFSGEIRRSDYTNQLRDFNYILQWSEHREKFFQELENSLNRLSRSLAMFLHCSDEDLVNKIDSGVKVKMITEHET